jgi:hypothetical protein
MLDTGAGQEIIIDAASDEEQLQEGKYLSILIPVLRGHPQELRLGFPKRKAGVHDVE